MEKDVPKRFQKKPAFMKAGMEEAARLRFEGGFDLAVNDMKRIFEASDSWVGKHWIPFVSHIYYPCDGAILWFSHDAFWKRYEENAAASIQPHPDISPWASAKERERIIARSAVMRAKIPWESVELPRDEEGDYNVGASVRAYQEMVAAALAEGKKVRIGRSREAVLRWFYVVGAIKLEIFGKVFWVTKPEALSRLIV